METEILTKSLEDALAEARDIAKRTDLNDEERTDLVARVEKIEGMKSQLSENLAVNAALAEHAGPADVEILAQSGMAESFGEAFINSEQFKAWDSNEFRTDLNPYQYNPGDYFTKAEPTVIDSVGAGSPALPAGVERQRVNTIQPLTALPLRVVDLIPQIGTQSNVVSYFQEATVTHTIAGALEGAEKGNFTLTGAAVTEELEVIAGMGAVTRQTLRDMPFMAAFINNRMTYKLREVEEDQVLNGNGTSPALNGILTRTTSTLSQGTDTLLDALYKALDKGYEDGGYPSTAIVIRPSDWQNVALAKDANDRYYGTGPFAQIIGDSVWGVNVVKSRKIAAGTVLTGAFDQAFVARNGGLTIRTSEHHSDYFKKNKVAILVESDIALGVYAPLAFVELTLA